MSNDLLRELVPKWFEPLLGKEAQSAFTRQMTSRLGILPDEVKGFPTVMKVRELIRDKLSTLLIQASGVEPGNVVTFHQRKAHHLPGGANAFGWEKGEKCIVHKIGRCTLSLKATNRLITTATPLYCEELLSAVGIVIDFTEQDARAIEFMKSRAEKK